MQKLTATINGILVPTTRNFWKDNQKVTRTATETENALALAHIEKQIAVLFGAFTTTPNTNGGWFDTDNNVMVQEPSFFVWCYSHADAVQANQLEIIAQALAVSCGQDSILLVINSEPWLT